MNCFYFSLIAHFLLQWIIFHYLDEWVFHFVKNPPAMQKTLVWFLGQEDPLVFLGFPCGSASKESACNARDLGSIPRLGRSPGEGKGYPLQYSCLGNSLDRGARPHSMGSQKSWIWLVTKQQKQASSFLNQWSKLNHLPLVVLYKKTLLGRKAITSLDSVLKSRDITLQTKVHLIKALIFPVVMYGCES